MASSVTNNVMPMLLSIVTAGPMVVSEEPITTVATVGIRNRATERKLPSKI